MAAATRQDPKHRLFIGVGGRREIGFGEQRRTPIKVGPFKEVPPPPARRRRSLEAKAVVKTKTRAVVASKCLQRWVRLTQRGISSQPLGFPGSPLGPTNPPPKPQSPFVRMPLSPWRTACLRRIREGTDLTASERAPSNLKF